MKNQKSDRKLPLRKETVRALDKLELDQVVGGNVTSTLQPTRICSLDC